MINKKLYIVIGTLFTVLLAISTSTLGLGFSNYNSSGVNRWLPFTEDFNCYQIDAEYAQGFGPNAYLMLDARFQDWLGGGNYNGVDLQPNGAVSWTLNVPPNPRIPLPGGFVNYPEVNWGPYHMALVLITTDNISQYGPAAPTEIMIEVDGRFMYQGWIWSRMQVPDETVHDGDNPTIPIDFHLNYGQGDEPTWDVQWWTGNQHFIVIENLGPNYIKLDEFHLTAGCYI